MSPSVGDRAPELVDKPLRVSDFVRYQGAAGDFNPIHYDTAVAQKAGFPGPFAVGMLQAGVLATYATDWLGARNIRRFKVRFKEQAWPGDVITYSGVVTDVRADAIEVELTATRQTGGVHLQGWATFVPEGGSTEGGSTEGGAGG